METYQISQSLHSFCRTFEKDLTKPQMGRTKELIHGILRGKKAVLSEIAKQNRKGRTIRKQVEQYSNMLDKLPLEQMLFRKCRGFREQIMKDTPVYLDLVDVTKKYHKSMEAIGVTWDGSEGEPGKGYELIDVSVGLHDRCTTILRRMYSTHHETYRSELTELEKILKTLGEAWGEIKGTLFLDAGNDRSRIIHTLLDYESTFCVRMNSNRGDKDRLVIDESGEQRKMMDLWGKPQGMTVWEDAQNQKKKIVQLQWNKIWWKHRKEDVPLYLVWCHRSSDKRPIVFLTSRTIISEEQAAKLYHQYFGRGKEEAGFKCHKDKLGMEYVQLHSFQKVKNFMLLYVLVDQLLSNMQHEAQKQQAVFNLLVLNFLKTEQREITKWSLVDFYDHYWFQLERSYLFFKKRYPTIENKNQLPLYSLTNEKW